MIQDTFRKIEEQLNQSSELSLEHRAELRELMENLADEISKLSETHPDDSKSISGFAQLSTQEAVRDKKRPDLLKHSLDGLSASVVGLETEHPKITALVNRACTLLSNMGI
ncbi:MAG: hypothetical protein M2R45_04408 [Verrucomicrobia subdivision 3 bacterium]|nr:hypothetical protein [Limisphaerales bacterium]MCS1417254.1 hypothetical protein [Limisphaerales bacterium]